MFNKYSDRGRALLVRFTCHRCGAQKIEELGPHNHDDPDGGGHLQYIEPPKGWDELAFGPLLCPECLEAFTDFMGGQKEVEG